MANIVLSEKLQDNIAKAFKFISNEPAVMQYYSLCEMIPVSNEKVTMRMNCQGTGSRAYIEYNPSWLEHVTDPSVIALLIKAEVMRLALHHCTTRLEYPIEILKLASDLVVFEDYVQTLSCEKEEVKKIIKMLPNYRSPEFAAIFKKYNFTEEDYFLEHMFAALKKEAQQQQKQSQQGGSGEGQEGQGQSGEDSQEGEGQSSNGSSNGSGENDKDSKGKDKGTGSEMGDALKKHFERSAENGMTQCEKWGENEQVDREAERVTREIVENGSSAWGNMSGHLKQMIMLANSPKIDVEGIMRNWVGRTISTDHYFTRMKVNRRHGWDISGVRRTKKCKVLIAIDVSGSMSDDDVATGMGFLNQFLKKAEVEYCYWDAECGEFTKSRKKMSEVEIDGRGGTDPKCVFDKIINEKADYDGIILYSDMYFDSPDIDRRLAPKVFGIVTVDGGNCPVWMRRHLDLKDIKEYMKKKI